MIEGERQYIDKKEEITQYSVQGEKASENEAFASQETKEQEDREVRFFEKIKAEGRRLMEKGSEAMEKAKSFMAMRKVAGSMSLALYTTGLAFTLLGPVTSTKAEAQMWGGDTITTEGGGYPQERVGRESGGIFESGDIPTMATCAIGGIMSDPRQRARLYEKCVDSMQRNRRDARKLTERQIDATQRQRTAETRKQEHLGLANIHKEQAVDIADINASARSGGHIPRHGGSITTEQTPTGARSTVTPDNYEARTEQQEQNRGGDEALQDYFGIKKPRNLGIYSGAFQGGYREEWNRLENKLHSTGTML